MAATYPVEFCCGLPAHPDDRSASDALALLRDPAFVGPIRVAVPRDSSSVGVPRGLLRDLLDALQDRNGGRTSEGRGGCAFRAVYRFAPAIAHAYSAADDHDNAHDHDSRDSADADMVHKARHGGGGYGLDGAGCEADSDDGGGGALAAAVVVDPLRSGFSDQAPADQQHMIDCMFKPAPAGRPAARVPLASIRITAAKQGQKTPHNQRAELFMWEAHHSLPHHRHPVLELNERMEVRVYVG
jgi:hypothetical protein